MNDNDRLLTETERQVLEAARDAGDWLSLLDLDHVRRLGAGDIATVPSLIEAGFLEHDPDRRSIRVTESGRRALEAPGHP